MTQNIGWNCNRWLNDKEICKKTILPPPTPPPPPTYHHQQQQPPPPPIIKWLALQCRKTRDIRVRWIMGNSGNQESSLKVLMCEWGYIKYIQMNRSEDWRCYTIFASSLKKLRPQQDSNLWRLWCQADALTSKLWKLCSQVLMLKDRNWTRDTGTFRWYYRINNIYKVSTSKQPPETVYFNNLSVSHGALSTCRVLIACVGCGRGSLIVIEHAVPSWCVWQIGGRSDIFCQKKGICTINLYEK